MCLIFWMFLPLDVAIMCPFLGYYISSTSQHPYSYTMPHTVLLRNSAIRFTLAAAVCKAPNTKLGNTLGRTHSYVGSSEDTNYHFNRASWLACSLQYICQLNISYIMPKLFVFSCSVYHFGSFSNVFINSNSYI